MNCEWYLTFHGGAERSELNSIHVYSADGKKVRKALDRSSLPSELELRELRGHAFGPDGDLYVANAFRDYSQIVRFHGLRNREGKHPFRDVFVQNDTVRNPGLDHPFNIAFDPHGDLYVTSQNANLTLRYHGPNSFSGQPGSPMPLPSSLAPAPGQKFYPGTFCASAQEVRHGLKVVRKAIFASGLLYVADRDADCIRKYRPETGAYLGEISANGLIDKPIHLIAGDGVLYIGNRGSDAVVRCDLVSEKVLPFVRPHAGGLKNPSGLAFGNDGYIYVASRSGRQILRYRLSDGKPDRRPFVDHLDDDPEFLERIEQR